MEQLTLREALKTYHDFDLLEDDNGETWIACNLIDAFIEGEREWPEDVSPGLTLDSLVYMAGENVYPIDARGYIGQMPVFRKITPPENPYRVVARDDGYRVIFMEDEERWKYRLVDGQSFYKHKQAAYRRKDTLNEYWRKYGFASEKEL